MLRLANEEIRIVYEPSLRNRTGYVYCLHVMDEVYTSGTRVKLMPADSNQNRYQRWIRSPEDRFLLAADPTYCLHVILDNQKSSSGTSKPAIQAFNGAQLVLWRVDRDYRAQAQQIWSLTEHRLVLAANREFCLMLWNGSLYPGARCDLWKASSIIGSTNNNGKDNNSLSLIGAPGNNRGVAVSGTNNLLNPAGNTGNTHGRDRATMNMLNLMSEHINEKYDLFAFTHWAETAPYLEDSEIFEAVCGRKKRQARDKNQEASEAEADAARAELAEARERAGADWRAAGTIPSWLPGPVDKNYPERTRITNASATTSAMLSLLRVDVISRQEIVRLRQLQRQQLLLQQSHHNQHQAHLQALGRVAGNSMTLSESTTEQNFQDIFNARRRAAMIRLDEELRVGSITHAQYLNVLELIMRTTSELQPHQLLLLLQPSANESGRGTNKLKPLLTSNNESRLSGSEDSKSAVERKINLLQLQKRQQAIRNIDAAESLISFYHVDADERKLLDSGAPDTAGRNRLSHHDDFVRQLDASLRRGQITQAQYDNMYSAFLMSDEEDRRSALRDLEALIPRQVSQSNWNALDRSLWIRICRFLTYTEAALLALVSKAVGKACSAQEIWYPKCHAFFLAHEPNWILPEPDACTDWKQYMRTYFTKWVPLAIEKSKVQHVEGLHVAVRFKPLPNEEQAEKRIALRKMTRARQQVRTYPSRDALDEYEAKDVFSTSPSNGSPYNQSSTPSQSSNNSVLSNTGSSIVGTPRVKFEDSNKSSSRNGAASPRKQGATPSSRNQGRRQGNTGSSADEFDEPRDFSKEKCRIEKVDEGESQVRTIAEDRPRIFSFDTVFSGKTTQKDVYDKLVKNLTRDVIFGFNATVFVYGQTASGKTWTMFGPDIVVDKEAKISVFPDRALWGIVPRACEQIIETLNHEHGTIYQFHVSYVEIYDNYVYDLLNRGTPIEVGERRDEFYLVNPELRPARTMSDIEEILTTGELQKTVHSTGMNQRSSRSHCLFTINLQQDNEERGFHEKNKYNLVDLAGSERYNKSKTQGKRFDEAKQINRSLQTLERCIYCLTNPNPQHIPYRESTLTKMLQQALGGSTNCKRILLVTCSCDQDQILETLSALRFAERANQINQNLGRSRKLAL